MPVKVQRIEVEEGEQNIGYAVVIMFLLFSASIILISYFYLYIYRFHDKIL
jgi:hypothetical protein